MKGKVFKYTALIVLVIAIVLFMTGMNSLALQRKAKIDLKDYVGEGKELPVGEYVCFDARYVFGPFAHKVSTSFFNTVKLNSQVTGYFYYLMLEDGTLMAVNTANEEEKATFDRISEKLLSANEVITDGETRRVNGRLREIKDEELIKIYQEGVRESFGASPDDPRVRYFTLDTTAGREWVFFAGIGALFVVLLAFITAGQLKGRKKTVPME